jgi:ribulose bisphosphate carboxylase small subunit
LGSINHAQAIKPDTAYLKKMIESSLLADWVIRIEYQGDESEDSCWALWDQAYFAIRSANPVVEALLACYTKHPSCTIRIYAEKIRPQTRLLFTVYNPQYLPAEADAKAKAQTAAIKAPQEHTPDRLPLQ